MLFHAVTMNRTNTVIYDVSNILQCTMLELLACLAPELEKMTRYVFAQVKEVASSLPVFLGAGGSCLLLDLPKFIGKYMSTRGK